MDPIYTYVDALPTDGVTVRLLKALDFVAPGQWQNLTGFDATIQAVTDRPSYLLPQDLEPLSTAVSRASGDFAIDIPDTNTLTLIAWAPVSRLAT